MIKNIFLSESLEITGGIESFEYNMAKHFKNIPNIEIEFWCYQNRVSEDMKKLMEPYGKIVEWDMKSPIECDNLFFPSRCIGKLDGKVRAKYIYECFHMAVDLRWNTQWKPWVTKCIGVSEAACKVWTEATGKQCECYYPIVDIDYDKIIETKKDDGILKLVTCARLNTSDKGAKRMKLLADALDKHNIKYKWTICGEMCALANDKRFTYAGKLIDKNDIYNTVVQNDFAVQLSDCEGFGMAISEALRLNVPIICTPITTLIEHLTTDNNCIVCNFDVSNADNVINRMMNDEFKFKYKPPMAGDWEKLLCNV